MKRAIVIVLDGVGAGVAPDAPEFHDLDEPSTLKHVWDAVGGFNAPNLAACGFLRAGGIDVDGVVPGIVANGLKTRYGRLKPLSKGGKDSVTGHWEMMGIVLDKPFPTYPDGFPIPLVKAFEKATGTQTLGNRAASGTKIIEDLGKLHVETGFPILYTSADSVFQLACHEGIVPIEKLYEWCQIARDLCVAPNNVQRIIARPFIGTPEEGFTRTEKRKDYPIEAPINLIDSIGDVFGVGVVPELFNGRGFHLVDRTQSNPEHMKKVLNSLSSESRFVFANFEDTDMLFGHRNDPVGFAKCLEEFDVFLGRTLDRLENDDLLILTADHGNDPTTTSTDHSREYVPFVAIGVGIQTAALGDNDGFGCVGASVAAHIGLDWKYTGHSLV
ncbi:MAG: phosphopentomutase [Fimbriimonadaceae bacterium]|nr:phosphopentomutase [Fimbriimonadaceae bacterium]